jgi:hypothetical protein
VRVERAFGLPERTSGDWHRQLLAAAARPLPGLRPALVPPTAERAWGEVLRFRHFLRHAYAVDLDGRLLSGVVVHLAKAVDETRGPVSDVVSAVGSAPP